ncbi:uncharacterized protein FOKN1_1905 [Thiohalobacter thiocyanaticus]|uniref:Transporter n=1 Tax=Thiohalobacter thiocyanaticus TaxID=585455 RepID=A0A1Z4VRM6_9GAMM|nr:transporter [Thiohalobacter thiocyanaticus]BAZ94287.1 uncharacterized protein FOKN1_1905 [Thiohalobacter thiocyanaticus]
MQYGARLSLLTLTLVLVMPGFADEADSLAQRLERMERLLDQQQRQLERQAATIAAQERRLQQQRRALDSLNRQALPATALEDRRGAGPAAAAPAVQAASAPPAQPVGTAPPASVSEPPEVRAIPELGGVLTPRGQLILEPGLQFSNSQINRLTFIGVEILEAFQIGLLEAVDVDRDYLAVSLTGRYGLTDRLELEAKLPYVYRKDRRVATIPDVEGEAFSRTLDGDSIGDLELALHYQLDWRWPGNMYYVGNLRYKSVTGRGPFDVNRNGDGIETELATGSGFHALEPSLTLLYPSDPAVFFANLGYLWHIEDDVNKTFGQQTIGKVDPGDAVRLSFGMGYAINPRASFTLGYKHDFIQETDTEINGVKLSTSSLDVGAMLLGYGFQLTERAAVNLNLELGVTADAPDVVMTLRLPYTF